MVRRKQIFALGLAVSLALVLGSQVSRAQDGVKRTDIQTHDLSIPGREVIQQMVELQPGVVVAKHTHPGEEITVILEGSLVLQMAGKPDVTLNAGQPLFVPAGVVHGVKTTSATKLLVTYVVEKGKPLRTDAK
jgi:quercetin dioxygenase-like cupin family protein